MSNNSAKIDLGELLVELTSDVLLPLSDAKVVLNDQCDSLSKVNDLFGMEGQELLALCAIEDAWSRNNVVNRLVLSALAHLSECVKQLEEAVRKENEQ